MGHGHRCKLSHAGRGVREPEGGSPLPALAMQVLYGMDYIAEERHVQHNLLRAALLEHVRQAPESRERPGAGPWWGPGEARVAAGAAGAGTALCLSCACIAGAAAIVATLAPGHLPVSPPPIPPLPPPKTRSSLISLQVADYAPPLLLSSAGGGGVRQAGLPHARLLPTAAGERPHRQRHPQQVGVGCVWCGGEEGEGGGKRFLGSRDRERTPSIPSVSPTVSLYGVEEHQGGVCAGLATPC